MKQGNENVHKFSNLYISKMCLFLALPIGLENAVESLIKNGADVNVANKDRETALTYAAAGGNLKTVFNYISCNKQFESICTIRFRTIDWIVS